MLIVYYGCKIKEKFPLKGSIFGIKGIQIEKISFFEFLPFIYSQNQ